ncbi:MAG: hypothetical protein EXQ88_04475 [Alphaproteobacteria bacterium]|nr:hypothetical protein [Alphaproteobacteria bacterium]
MQPLRFILLALLPSAVYLAWLGLLYWRARVTGSTEIPALRHGPWFWLILAGIALAGAGFVAVALFEERIPAGQYQPPRLEDGRIVPAQRAPSN